MDVTEVVSGNGRPNRATRRKLERKTYRLVWPAGHDMAGTEVLARSLPLGIFIDVLELAAGVDFTHLDATSITPEAAQAVKQLLGMFADALIEWNLDDDEGEVPADYQGLRRLDVDVAMPMVDAWIEAVAGVSGPLGQTSPAGDKSLEASMPMDAPSASPPS